MANVENGARVVDVRVSALADQVPLLRSVAADIAMRLDFDLDAIEDLRMAVDEACSLLVRVAAPAATLTCRFTQDDDRIDVLAEVAAAEPVAPSHDPMSWQILTALTATLSERVIETADGHQVTIELRTVRGDSPAGDGPSGEAAQR